MTTPITLDPLEPHAKPAEAPFYLPMTQDTQPGSFLDWAANRWQKEQGVGFTIKNTTFGKKGTSWSQWVIGWGTFMGLSSLLEHTTGVKLHFLTGVVTVPLCLGIPPAIKGSLRAFKHAREEHKNHFQAFGSMVKRIGLKYSSVNGMNLHLYFPFLGMLIPTLAVKGTQKLLEFADKDSIAQKLNPLENSLSTKTNNLLTKINDHDRWRVGQLVKAATLDGGQDGLYEELYSDWAKVTFLNRWDQVQDAYLAYVDDQKEEKIRPLLEKLDRQYAMGDGNGAHAVMYQREAEEKEIYRSFNKMMDAQKPIFEEHQGLLPAEVELKKTSEAFFKNLTEFQTEIEVLFQRTEASGINPWYSPAPGLPSLLSLVEHLKTTTAELDDHQDAFGRLRSLQEAHEIDTFVGEITPASSTPKPRSSSRL